MGTRLATLATIAGLLAPVSTASLPVNTSSILTQRDPGEGYTAGTASWTSHPGSFVLFDGGVGFFLQSDGNLVVYDTTLSTVLWDSGVGGQDCGDSNCYLAFQGDGDLVACEDGSPPRAFWSTGTNAFPGHEVPAASLFLAHTPPYIQLYSQDLKAVWWTSGATGVVVQNPDTADDPPQNGGVGPPVSEPSQPDACKGSSMNCRVYYSDCRGPLQGDQPDWSSDDDEYGGGDGDGDGNDDDDGIICESRRRGLLLRWLWPLRERACT